MDHRPQNWFDRHAYLGGALPDPYDVNDALPAEVLLLVQDKFVVTPGMRVPLRELAGFEDKVSAAAGWVAVVFGHRQVGVLCRVTRYLSTSAGFTEPAAVLEAKMRIFIARRSELDRGSPTPSVNGFAFCMAEFEVMDDSALDYTRRAGALGLRGPTRAPVVFDCWLPVLPHLAYGSGLFASHDARMLLEQISLLNWPTLPQHRNALGRPMDLTELSYYFASFVPMSHEDRQVRVLETNTSARMEMVIQHHWHAKPDGTSMAAARLKCSCGVALQTRHHNAKRDYPIDALSAEGAYTMYMNPGGYVFPTLRMCFQHNDDTLNLRAQGRASDEHTWIPEFLWIVLQCSNCNQSLGWQFSSTGNARRESQILLNMSIVTVGV